MFWETICIFFKDKLKKKKKSQTIASQHTKVSWHKAFLVLLMASGYKFSSVRVLGGGVFLLASRPLVFALESIKNRRVSGFGLFSLYFSSVFLCSALYHFMFASCMNSCGRSKGSGCPRHFPGK